MDKPAKEWTAIVLTSRTLEDGEAIKSELLTYQKKGFIHQSCIVLVVEDPVSSTSSGVGSGTATINALFYVVEQLSARRGYHVLSADVLIDSNILVLHHGRSYPFGNPLGAFTLLPGHISPSKDYVEITTNILHLYNFATTKLLPLFGSGFWVCSTDMIIDYDQDAFVEPSTDSSTGETDACIITVPAEPFYASKHGVVLTGQNGLVQDLLYRAPESTLQSFTQEGNELQLISGIVYMSVGVSERLLALQRFPAIESCTYLSTDVGSEPHSVSFFFDMLLAMSDGIREEDFMKRGSNITKGDGGASGDASKAMGTNVRRIIWNKMRHFRLSSFHIPFARHIYLSTDLSASEYLNIMKSLGDPQSSHSFVSRSSSVPSHRFHSANSCLIDVEPMSGNLHVTNSFLENRLRIEEDACIYNVDTRMSYIRVSDKHLNFLRNWLFVE
ncbi:hypothetical protein RvY_15894-3 [Ramazzottius varieornatus]|uniref:GDP-fucose pyrophosphorylase domain-containing protein n=1 Tax=Ramazzottius varieornatus TaxID=947166 RepID=A0A1D1VXM2_RAMVA|nr:hypothetical protein RvY_15894-3 [Ramazzottius varieornatus]